MEPGFPGAVAFARDLIRIPSPPGGEGELAGRVRREMEALGYDEVWIDGIGNVIGVIRGRGEAPPVMLSCHLDAVAVGEEEAWEHPPFGGEVSGGFLHGRGAMDIKGPLAIQTHAAALLRGSAAGDVIVAHTVLEERGGWGMAFLLRAGEVRPGAVIVGEATGGDVAVGHRGRVEVEVEVRGVAAHASAPSRARNPLDLLPPVLRGIRDHAETVSGREDPLLGPATLVATSVEVEPRSRNVVPDVARVVVDWRILPGPGPDELALEMERRVRERVGDVPPGYRLEVRVVRERQRSYTGLEEVRPLFTPGFLLDPGHPVARAAAEAVGARRVRPWTFATDGGHTCGVHGIPTVGYAPGEERYAHTNRERLSLAQAEEAFRRYPELIRAVQRAAGEAA